MPSDHEVAAGPSAPRRLSAAPTEGQRLHPFSLLFSIGQAARNLLIPGLLVWFAADNNRYELFLMVLFVPATLRALLKYATFRYRFAEGELVMKEGLIFRNERHVPFHRIQNIDWTQNPLHRLLRVASVRVETAGGTEPEAELQVLTVPAAEEMRHRVFEEKRRAGDPAAASLWVPDASEKRELARLGVGDLVLLGLISNRGLAIAAAGLGVAWELDFFDPSKWEEWFAGSLGQFIERVPDTWLWRSTLILAAILTAIVALRLLSVAWALLQFWNFRLAEQESGLRATYGFFTRHTSTIPRPRVQLVTQIESIGQRWVGRRGLRVVTAGGDADDDDQSRRRWLLPIGERKVVARLADLVQPETAAPDLDWQPVEGRAFRRVVKRELLIAVGVLVLPVLWWSAWWGTVVLLTVPWAIWDARARVRRMRWALSGAGFHFRSGLWTHKVSAVRFNKIQTVQCVRSPFDRRYGMATLAVDIAGLGNADHRIHVRYLDSELAESLRVRLANEAATTRFRW